MTDWFRDGGKIDSIAIDDRGLHYGDGLFETIAIRAGEPRLWFHHMDRLRVGCSALSIMPPDVHTLRSSLEQSLRASGHAGEDCLAKLILTAGSGQRGYARASNVEATVVIGIFTNTPVDKRAYRQGVDTMLCKTPLANSPNLAGLKTLNRLEQVIARSEVVENKLFEGFTLDTAGNVICGTMSNVFFVSKKIISTPSLEHCGVKGVMRRHVIDTLLESGIKVSFRSPAASAINECDEVFISNSQFGVLPVRRCEATQWAVGDVTRQVMSLMADHGITECRL